MNGYDRLIVKVTNCFPSIAPEVQEIMRESVGTLDGLGKSQFKIIAKRSLKLAIERRDGTFRKDPWSKASKIDLKTSPWNGLKRRDQILHLIRRANGRPVIASEVAEQLGMDSMSYGPILARLVETRKLERVPKVGPKGGAGYILYKDPFAEILKEIQTDGKTLFQREAEAFRKKLKEMA